MSQVDIAKRLGVSTATVSRMLQRARDRRDRAHRDPGSGRGRSSSARALTGELGAQGGRRGRDAVRQRAGGARRRRSARCSGGPASCRARCWPSAGGGRSAPSSTPGLPPIPGVLIVPATGGMQQHLAAFPGQRVRAARRRAARRRAAFHPRALPALRRRPRRPFSPIRRSRRASRCGTGSTWRSSAIGLPHARNSPEASAATPDEQALVERRRRRHPPLLRRQRAADRLGGRGPDDRGLAGPAAPGAAGDRRRDRRRKGRCHPRARSAPASSARSSPTCAPPRRFWRAPEREPESFRAEALGSRPAGIADALARNCRKNFHLTPIAVMADHRRP